jgi:hypothetical protein
MKYFTLENMVTFGLRSGDVISSLPKDTPLFTVATEHVIYRKDTYAFLQGFFEQEQDKRESKDVKPAIPASIFIISSVANETPGKKYHCPHRQGVFE